jgi:outer membrane usher protein FimD/PapC
MTGRRLRGAHLRLALLPLSCAPDIAQARIMVPDELRNDDVEFDENMLKLRGIDPKLAAYFREAPRFTAGRHEVSLSVNGKAMGRANARFDQNGALCIDRDLMDVAEVNVVGDASAVSCLDLRSMYPRANVEVDPGSAAISLLVPTEALRVSQQDLSGFTRGGDAALLNYELVGLDSRGRSGGSRYGSANTELGFNAGDWMVRSRQVTTVSDGRHRNDVLDTYAQRSFAEYRAVLQMGEISLTNPALSGAQITGIQVMSEQALALQGSRGIVEGIAPGPARVEVRQDGVLVYSTVVPAGPFSLTQIPRINRSADLDVTVMGENGESQHFVVTAAMAGPMAPLAGYSFAVGRTRNTGGEAPWVVSGGWSGTVRQSVSLSGGVMAASSYRAIGGGAAIQTTTGTQLQLNVTGSHAQREDAFGLQAALILSQRLGGRWSLGFAQTRQSLGYRNLLDTTPGTQAATIRSRYRDQSSATLSWSPPELGSLSAGYSRTILFDGRRTSRALASWGTRIGRASVSLSAEWSLGTTRGGRDNSVYLNVSLPLGEHRRLSSSMRRHGAGTRHGVNLSEQINEYASYRAGLEYQSVDRRSSLTAGVSLLPRYFQLDAGYAHNPTSSSHSLGLRGGLVLHAHGLTASPYAVRETFGVLAVDGTAGVRVSTPAGPVWTDARGYAVLPQLSPFGKSHIEVVTSSLPRHLDIHNGAAVVQMWRGAVTTLRFGVSKTRRVLLSARSVDGHDLPMGATVTDEDGELVSLVQGSGQIFVPNALTSSRLWVTAPGFPRCELTYELAASPDADAYYESAPAVCHTAAEVAP